MYEAEDILKKTFSDIEEETDIGTNTENQEDTEEVETGVKPKRSRRKKKVIPEGIHKLERWRLEKDFSLGELSTLLKCDVKTLNSIEHNKYEPTEKQKQRIQLMTGIKL